MLCMCRVLLLGEIIWLQVREPCLDSVRVKRRVLSEGNCFVPKSSRYQLYCWCSRSLESSREAKWLLLNP